MIGKTFLSGFVFLVAMFGMSCTFKHLAADMVARPDLEVDGKNRAITVSLSDIPDEHKITAVGGVEVAEWRRTIGSAFAYAFRDSFVLSSVPGPDVLRLVVTRADPKLVVRGNAVYGQITYAAQISTPDGTLLGRAAGVAEGPEPTSAIVYRESALRSAIETLVREITAKLVPVIPEVFPSAEVSRRKLAWVDDNPPPAKPTPPKPVEEARDPYSAGNY